MRVPLGSFNLGRRGELPSREGRNRADDKAQRSDETSDGESLNHERRGTACRKTQMKTVPNCEESASMDKGALLRSVPRNHGPPARGNYAVAGAADIRRRPGGYHPLATRASVRRLSINWEPLRPLGVVAGCLTSQSGSKAVAGECGLSRSGNGSGGSRLRVSASNRQGSRGLVRVAYGWCRVTRRRRKG